MMQMSDKKNNIGLCYIYEDMFPIGTAINAEMIERYGSIITDNFSSITPENELKTHHIHPEEDRYEFDKADYLVDYALMQGMKVRGHTLLWHESLPDWLVYANDKPVSKDVFLKRLKEHIYKVADRYRDKIYCWDVVNEVISDAENEFFRDMLIYQIAGEEFVEKAFHYAHEAAPKALLYLNDYNACISNKCDKIYRLVKKLKSDGVPIHGIGLQGHYNINFPSSDAIDSALNKLSELELDIQITEMDVSMYGYENRRKDITSPSDDMLERQKIFYDRTFEVYRKYKDIISGVTLWGVADDYTWLDEFPVQGRKDWPLLYDVSLHKKPAYDAISCWE